MWDLNRLRLLRELELRGTITQVAAALRFSPSSVSQQLALLEREVGVPLLEPDGRRVRLTAHGKAVAQHAEEIIRLQEQMRGRLEQLRGDPPSVHIASIESATKALLPRMLDALAAGTPDAAGVDVRITVVPPEHSLGELETRQYDLVIAEQYPGYSRERREGIHYLPLGDDPIRIAIPPDGAERSMAELRDHAWVMEPEGSASRNWAVQQCRQAGFEPDVRFVATDLDAHVSLISTGHAVGILPDLMWAGRAAPVRLLELPLPLHRELFTAARASRADAPGIVAVRRALAAAL